jgi:hypothetical protein
VEFLKVFSGFFGYAVVPVAVGSLALRSSAARFGRADFEEAPGAGIGAGSESDERHSA